jgi:antitoxin MazE
MYIHQENSMQVAKWGNSLAVRFPASLVAALNLKEGEEIELHMVGEKSFEVIKKPSREELLSKLRQLRGKLPADFHFDRLEANEPR